jgi:2-dehydrotetronate isomerase
MLDFLLKPMPKFAANLSFLYPELPFLDRFEAAAKDGFKAVEYLFPYAYDPRELAARLRAHDLEQVLFNLPPGGTDAASIDAAWQSGMRGLACIDGTQAEQRTGIELALRYAEALQCPRVHMIAGIVPLGQTQQSVRRTYINSAQAASKLVASQGLELLIEPINTRDMPGFFLNRQDDAHALIADIGQPNVKVQMDLYHCQIVEGDVASKIRHYLPSGSVGHFQIAGVPERHEPNVGELNYAYLFDVIDALGYTEWIGCEYRPRLGVQSGGTSAGLGWFKPYLG